MTFDIEKAKQTMKAQTRSGAPVDIISFEGREPYVILGYVGDDIEPVAWTASGEIVEGCRANFSDLFNTTVKREGWVNVYVEGDKYWCGAVSFVPDDLPGPYEHANTYATTIKIEWEE